VFILKGVKVVCFDTLLQVLIVKELVTCGRCPREAPDQVPERFPTGSGQAGQGAPGRASGTGRGEQDIEEMEEVQEAASAASRRFIRDAKAASRNPMRDTKTVLWGG